MKQILPPTHAQTLFIYLFLFSGLFSNPCFALSSWQQDTIPKKNEIQEPVYNTVRLTTSKPVIDSKLADECWKTGEWAGNWTQGIPHEGGKPTYPTEMKILYDDRNHLQGIFSAPMEVILDSIQPLPDWLVQEEN